MQVNQVKINLQPMAQLEQAAACLKVMAHPVRLRIVDILMQGNFSVGEIAEMCAMKHHQICEHLRHMQACGLLTSERAGQKVYYKIASKQLPLLMNCIRHHCDGINVSNTDITDYEVKNEQKS